MAATSRVAAYLRVSTVDQQNGLDSQEEAIRRYLDGHGIEAKFYRDRMSGATTKRPSFERLQRDIFNGRIRTVVAWKLDRLSRNLRDGINILCNWLEQDVRVVAVSQQLDFSGPTGQLIASVLFAVAAMERENLRENTKRGLQAAKARGVQLGRSRKLHADDIIFALKGSKSVAAVAREMDVSRAAIYKALGREGYCIESVRKLTR